MRRAFWLAVPLAVGIGACDAPGEQGAGTYESVMAFDSAAVTIRTAEDTVQVRAEVARTEAQRAHGLMERTRLAEDAGMLFLYPSPQDSSRGFYMFRTRIPLDIAFFDEEGRIISIRTMAPCESPDPSVCRMYRAERPFSGALEVNEGFFEGHGVTEGDLVLWEDT